MSCFAPRASLFALKDADVTTLYLNEKGRLKDFANASDLRAHLGQLVVMSNDEVSASSCCAISFIEHEHD
jgi:hypothetical protein